MMELEFDQSSTQEMEDGMKSVEVQQPRLTIDERLGLTFESPQLLLDAPDLSIDYAWELQSQALEFACSAKDLFDFVKEHKTEHKTCPKEPPCSKETPCPKKRIAAYKSFANATQIVKFGEKSWEIQEKMPDHEPRLSIYQSITLKAHETRRWHDSPYEVRMNPPGIDKSCRFHRHYGDRRFLMLRVPFASSSDNEFRTAVVKWLSRCELKIAGRAWRMFWVDDKGSKVGDRWYYTVHLFAVSGTGLEPISLEKFIKWHSPVSDNIASTNLKYFARFKLGLSKTTPTIVLEKDEFIVAKDVKSAEDKVMNDGCALMSLELAAAITHCMGLDELPTIFQGRISGCKGLWMVDRLGSRRHNLHGRDFWIQITPSQLKIQPHPSERDATDEALRTFEVSNFSTTLQPSALNFQFINVLYNRGVRKEILEQRLKATFNEYYNELCEGIGTFDVLKCRAWLQRYHAQRPPDGGGLLFTGSKPQLRSDTIKYMLDAGFTPKDCRHLDGLIKETLKAYTDDLVERVRISLPRSTFAYMMADPYSLLEEDEVQLCLPQTWKDPELGLQGSVVANRMGLVGRNPANLPCDIQKVKFVHHVELGCYHNVIIFSIKGKRPLADYLSGGDYDGDQAFVCWDQDLVKDFVNYNEVPTDEISPTDVGLEQKSRPLAEFFMTSWRRTPTLLEDYWRAA
jgi:hypothetical protein